MPEELTLLPCPACGNPDAVISAFRCELAQNPGMLDRYRKGRAA